MQTRRPLDASTGLNEKGDQGTLLVVFYISKTMYGLNSSGRKSIEQLREEIDETILLHVWSQTSACPLCGCDSDIQFGERTPSGINVEVDGCELCTAVLQSVVGDSLD